MTISGDGVLNPPEGFPYFTTFIAKPNVCWCHGHVYVMQSMQWCNYWVLHCHNNNPRKANNPSKPFPNPASENSLLRTSQHLFVLHSIMTSERELKAKLYSPQTQQRQWNEIANRRRGKHSCWFYFICLNVAAKLLCGRKAEFWSNKIYHEVRTYWINTFVEILIYLLTIIYTYYLEVPRIKKITY